MKSITRRDLLRGLAASSVFAVFRPLAGGATGWAQQTAASPFQRLNVLFHGMFVVDFGTDEVDVYAPNISEHGYLAGTWMQEANVAQGQDYRLSGVVTGPRPDLASLNPKQNAIFKRQPVNASYSFCRYVLPFPDHVASLRLFKKIRGKNFFLGSPAPILQPSELPDILVFTYARPDPTSVLECKPLTWTPVIEDGVVNLHVWALPAQAPGPNHSQQAFQQLSKLMGSSTLALNPVYASIRPPQPDLKPTVQGVSCQEELSLVERMSGGASCGKQGGMSPRVFTPYDCISAILY
ncbi:MAG TPA: hypothetical protein VGS20_15390 [Candidatus Acidoferrales bacterium]|nr:hypothetical protein [Candidatus Acidoferrales bacterium]